MSDPIYRSRSRRQHPSPTAVQTWITRGKRWKARLEYYVGSKKGNLSTIFAMEISGRDILEIIVCE